MQVFIIEGSVVSTIKLDVLWLFDEHMKMNKINKRRFICLKNCDTHGKTMKKIEWIDFKDNDKNEEWHWIKKNF